MTHPDPVRQWLRYFAFAALGLLGTIAGVNLVVDPLGYYDARVLPVLTWSSRADKVSRLRARPATEVLVLGSSRSMKLAPSDIAAAARGACFNAAVDSGRTEDWLAFLRFAVESCHAPVREVVLGVDIEAFRNGLEPDARLLANRDLRGFLPWDFQRDYFVTASEMLVSFEQLRMSAESVRLHLRGYPEPESRFDDDGFLHYLRWERQIAEGTFVPDLEASQKEYDARFAGFTDLDPRRREIFEGLLDYALQRHIRVRGFVTPLSPPLLEHLRKTRDVDRLRALLLEYLSKLAGRFGNFSISDFTDVSSWGGDPGGFLDGAHMSDENARRLVRALFAVDPATAETR